MSGDGLTKSWREAQADAVSALDEKFKNLPRVAGGPIAMAPPEDLLGSNEGPFDDKPMSDHVTHGVRSVNDETFGAFVLAARKLKSAEAAVLEARAEYAEAVKKLSEEAVR